MLQDLQKTQLEERGGNPFAGPRPQTLKVQRKSRLTNESFRVAVDRSYDTYLAPHQVNGYGHAAPVIPPPHMNMSHPPPQAIYGRIPPRVPPKPTQHASAAALSLMSNSTATQSYTNTVASTVTGTTTTATSNVTDDDSNVGLMRRKGSKKGIFSSFFKLGSRKSKKKKNQSVSQDRDREKDAEAENLRARRAAQLEQEKIQVSH